MSEMLGVPVTAREGVEEVVRGSDMVATCTDSVRVVVENSGWVEDGAFVTCVRSNEWEPGILDRCDVIVKLGRGTIGTLDEGMRRIAGYASYVAGTEDETSRIVTPSVDLFAGRHPLLTDLMGGATQGRTKDSDVTLFLNDGTQGLQFASVAGYVVRKAKELGAGREIPREWFTQDIRD
jgi:alanine dehydrogenase